MTPRPARVIDISDVPEIVRLAEEASAAQEALLLRRDGNDLALLLPLGPMTAPRRRGAKSPADEEEFRSAAGSWKDVDIDRLIADIYESRRRSSRPPVEL